MPEKIRQGDWTKVITPFLKKYKKQTDAIFRAYNKEVKAKKLTTIPETNGLWREKYASKMDAIEKKHDIEYKKIWNKFHNVK